MHVLPRDDPERLHQQAGSALRARDWSPRGEPLRLYATVAHGEVLAISDAKDKTLREWRERNCTSGYGDDVGSCRESSCTPCWGMWGGGKCHLSDGGLVDGGRGLRRHQERRNRLYHSLLLHGCSPIPPIPSGIPVSTSVETYYMRVGSTTLLENRSLRTARSTHEHLTATSPPSILCERPSH